VGGPLISLVATSAVNANDQYWSLITVSGDQSNQN